MKWKLFCVLWLALSAPAVFGQTMVTGQITSAAATCPPPQGNSTSCVFLQISPAFLQTAITIPSTPAFSATLQFEWSGDGGNTWNTLSATPNGGGTAVTSTTAAGVWTVSTGGASFIRVRASAYTSGVAQVTLNPSQAVTGVGLTSGGGGVTFPILAPNGTAGAPSYGFSTNAGGMFSDGQDTVFSAGSTQNIAMFNQNSAAFYMTALGTIGWGGSGLTTFDTGMSRLAAGVIGFGTQAQNTTSSKLKAAGYMSVGTTFTSNAGCTESALTGGATAGKFTTSGSTSCSTTITMGNSATAPNGWQCVATDLTTVGDAADPHQTASTTTTATIATGTIAAGDVISFSCIGY